MLYRKIKSIFSGLSPLIHKCEGEKFRVDLYYGLIVFLLGVSVGWAHIQQTSLAVEDIIRSTFSPAINLACNGRFEGIHPSDYSPQLSDFLDQKVEDFDCENLTSSPQPYALGITEYQSHHLLYISGGLWKLTGVKWKSLSFLQGILLGLTAIFTYGLFRLVMSRGIAFFVTILAVFNPLFLFYLRHLRDYSKTPFLMGGMFILSMFLFRCRSRRDMWVLSSFMGAIIALGLGFRQDALILIPIFFMVLIFFVPKNPLIKIRDKCVGGIFFTIILFGVSHPVHPGYVQGSNSGHVILLGQTTVFEPALNIRQESNVSSYDIGHRYDDSHMSYLIRYYDYWNSGKDIDIYPNKEYERASIKYYVDLWRHFPADQIKKILGSALSISRLFSFSQFQGIIDSEALNKFQAIFVQYDNIVGNLRQYNYLGICTIVLASFFLVLRKKSSAVFFLLSYLYFSAITSFQYSHRHAFYLQFYFWWAIGIILSGVYHLLKYGFTEFRSNLKMYRGILSDKTGPVFLQKISSLNFFRHKSIVSIFMLFCLGCTGGVIFVVFSFYQKHHVDDLMAQYVNSLRVVLDSQIDELENGDLRYVPTGLIHDLREVGSIPWVASSSVYLVIEIDLQLCQEENITIIARYESSGAAYDHSRSYSFLNIKKHDGKILIFFPAFFHKRYSRFAGMDFPRKLLQCFSMNMLPNSSDLPMPLFITLFPDWNIHPPMKRLDVNFS